jgi:hypothetical protein
MGTILIIVLVILLLGGGGYYGYNHCGGQGPGGVFCVVLSVPPVVRLLGGTHFNHW